MNRILRVLSIAFLFGVLLYGYAEETPADREALTHIRWSRGGYLVPETYEICLREGEYCLLYNEEAPRRIDRSYVEEICAVIEAYDLLSWDGFSGSDPDVLDGEGFSLSFTFSNGTSVHASGENCFPKEYHTVMGCLDGIMEKERMALIAGTYVYEGDGFGGDFAIMLCSDGTYTFYEGPLSSYMGGGEWHVYTDELFLFEKNGFELRNIFVYKDGAILFDEINSDNFPYIKVPNMGKFIKSDTDKPATEKGSNDAVPGGLE